YLFGTKRKVGVWYYFPVVASYKVPVGIAVVFVLALGSLWSAPLKWQEVGLLIPMLAWTTLMLTSKINIGFRHFLPAYVFMLMFAARAALLRATGWKIATWCAVLLAAAHTLSYHPDYL